jgi:hypothetical protein
VSGRHAQRRTGARDPPQEHATRHFVPRQIGQRPPVDRLAGHDDVHDVGRKVEQVAIIHLAQPAARRLQYLDQGRARPGHRHHVAFR